MRGPLPQLLSRRLLWFLGLSILALASVLLPEVDWRSGLVTMLALGPAAVLVLLPFGLQLVADTFGWSLLLKRLGRAPGFAKLFSVRVATEAVLLSLSGGVLVAETLKPLLLKRSAGVPLGETVATVSVRKALLVTSEGLYLVLAACAVALLLPRDLGGVPYVAAWVAAAAVALLAAGGLLLTGLSRGAFAGRTHELLSRVPWSRFTSWLEAKKSAFLATDRHLSETSGGLLPGLAAYLGVWLLEAAESYLFLRLLGVELPFFVVLAVEAVASLLRSLAFFVPAGLGVQDAGYLAAFHALGLPGAGTVGPAFVLIKRMKELVWVGIGWAVLLLTSGTPRSLAAEAAPGG